MKRLRQIRRSQVIAPFGVGAVYDIGDESLTCCDINRWRPNDRDEIRLPRLERNLRVARFYSPPVPSGRFDRRPPSLLFYRFPQWLFCPSCRKMSRWSTRHEQKNEPPACENPGCQGKTLVPMRFVLACEHGHLGDVPWDYWVHARRDVAKKGRCERPELYFRTKAASGGGLESLEVYCKTCKTARSLGGIVARDSMLSIGVRCSGKQPWQRSDDRVECDATPQVLQRGASNLYYPSVVSALDIPCGNESITDEGFEDEIRNHPLYQFLVRQISSQGEGPRDVLACDMASQIADQLHCEQNLVLSVASGSNGHFPEEPHAEESQPVSERDLLAEEWPALFNPPYEDRANAPYLAEIEQVPEELDPFGIRDLIDRVVLVRRLREVRAFRGFHRITPSDPENMVPADLGRGQPWLPAVEVFGEGVFLAFSEEAIERWLNLHGNAVNARILQMKDRWEASSLGFLPEPTPRLVMLHTFSHLMMRQLSFECGYSASSLRERIYHSEPSEEAGPMAGLLIYTADSDSEGSLGGLVRQGRADRLMQTITAALRHGAWCSSDPICKELPGQGLQGLNLAACHACTLVSETSCVMANTLLDRMVLLANDDRHGQMGFMSSVLEAMERGQGR